MRLASALLATVLTSTAVSAQGIWDTIPVPVLPPPLVTSHVSVWDPRFTNMMFLPAPVPAPDPSVVYIEGPGTFCSARPPHRCFHVVPVEGGLRW